MLNTSVLKMLTPPDLASYGRLLGLFDDAPVASLTRGMPQGIDTDILVLGRGDVRSILYTAYCEQGFPPRKIDVTSCHDDEISTGGSNVLYAPPCRVAVTTNFHVKDSTYYCSHLYLTGRLTPRSPGLFNPVSMFLSGLSKPGRSKLPSYWHCPRICLPGTEAYMALP